MREEILKSEWNRDESPLALYARGVFLILGNHIQSDHGRIDGSGDGKIFKPAAWKSKKICPGGDEEDWKD